jgi:hypothetical protein
MKEDCVCSPNSASIVKTTKILELSKTIIQAYVVYFWPLLNSCGIKFLKCCSKDVGIHYREPHILAAVVLNVTEAKNCETGDDVLWVTAGGT